MGFSKKSLKTNARIKNVKKEIISHKIKKKDS